MGSVFAVTNARLLRGKYSRGLKPGGIGLRPALLPYLVLSAGKIVGAKGKDPDDRRAVFWPTQPNVKPL